MTSDLTNKRNAAFAGNINSIFSGSAVFQEQFIAKDVVTTGATEVANNFIDLFGNLPGMQGIELMPERIIIRTGGTAGTISYVGKIVRIDSAGNSVDVTGSITLNRTLPTVAAAVVTPQTPLAAGEKLRLVLTTVTTHVAGVTWAIELPFTKRNAPGMA